MVKLNSGDMLEGTRAGYIPAKPVAKRKNTKSMDALKADGESFFNSNLTLRSNTRALKGKKKARAPSDNSP